MKLGSYHFTTGIAFFFVISSCLAPPIGLVNEGNTCYQNATLQCLYAIPALRDYMLNQPQDYFLEKDEDGDPSIAYVFRNLIRNINATQVGATVTPRMFCARALTKLYNFTQGEQDDPYDFISKIFDHLGGIDVNPRYKRETYGYPSWQYLQKKASATTILKDVNYPLRNALTDLFSFSYVLSYNLGEKQIEKLEPLLWTYLIQSSQGLNNALATKRNSTFLRSPEHLIIALDIGAGRTPFTSRLVWPYVQGVTHYRAKYDLIGIVIHQGISLRVGHYTAYVKTENNVWFFCDDTRVTKKEPPFHSFASTGNTIEGDQPRLLFFKRASALPSPLSEVDLLRILNNKGINNKAIEAFLANRSSQLSRNVTFQAVLDGINNGVNTTGRLIEEMSEFLQPEEPDLGQQLAMLEVDLMALGRLLPI